MNREVKKLIVAFVLILVCKLVELVGNLTIWQLFAFYLIPYILLAYDFVTEIFESFCQKIFFSITLLTILASIGAMVIGFWDKEPQFFEANAVLWLFCLGELLEDYAKTKTHKQLDQLKEIKNQKVRLVEDKTLTFKNCEHIRINDTILVLPSEQVPLDGMVLNGESQLNMALLTGESIPITIKPNEKIMAGAIVLDNSLTIKVKANFENSMIGKIVTMVENSTAYKSKTQRFIDKFANIYTPIIFCLSVLVAFVMPLIFGPFEITFSSWAYRSLNFLIVACPCAVVISVPLSFFCAMGLAAKKKILIKGGKFMETLAKTQTFVFDKTGTITNGSFGIKEINLLPCEKLSINKEEVFDILSCLEQYDNHPVAKVFKSSNHYPFTNITPIKSKGLIAYLDKSKIIVGSNLLLESNGIAIEQKDVYGIAIHIVIDNQYCGYVFVEDSLKEGAIEVFDFLEKNNYKTIIMSGDKQLNTKLIADKLNVKQYYSCLLSEQKAAVVKDLIQNQDKKSKLCFVGEGFNDAPSLSMADISIAMGQKGSSLSLEVADIVILDDNLKRIPLCIDISKKAILISKENIIMTLSIKFIVLVLSFFGYCDILLAVLSDVGVTVLAILNSLRNTYLSKVKFNTFVKK